MKKNNNRNLTEEAMTVIINIQCMNTKINENYNTIEDFYNLQWKNIDDLRQMQDNLIPLYNESIKNKK